MTRTARIISDSKLYHIIMRGINKQIIFEEKEDFIAFIRMTKNCIEKHNVIVIAYVLMNNHVHLVIKDNDDNLSLFMQSLGLRYAKYFNKKYDRVGSLFQDRFVNVPITSERQLHSTVAYVIKNPERAGICDFKTYRWSSYFECTKGTLMITDINYFQEFADNIPEIADTNNICKDTNRHILTDSEAGKIIYEIMNGKSGTELLKYDKARRNDVIRELKQRRLSIRQIERLTGISKGIIQKVK